MPASVLDKLASVVDQIDRVGNAELTRLTVLKKWFDPPGRLGAFALWVASRAASRGSETGGPAGKLFRDAHALLAEQATGGELNPAVARDLHRRLRAFQDTYQRLKWGSARIVKEPDLLLVEEGLAIYLWHPRSPTQGYKLAASYCRNFDPRYGNGLNGPSRVRLEEIVDFIKSREAQEPGNQRDLSPLPTKR